MTRAFAHHSPGAGLAAELARMIADRDRWRDEARRLRAETTVAAAARRLRAMRDAMPAVAGQGRMFDGR